MKKSFSSRRAPKRIGASSSDEDSSTPSITVKRPPLVSKSSKKKSTISRLSFGPGTPSSQSSTQNTSEQEESFIPRRPIGGLGRLAVERNAELRNEREREREREESSSGRYSKEALKELASSTPSTPRNEELILLDRTQLPAEGYIPSKAEIREKKERRARLAKEQEFISLYGEEDDQEADLIIREKDKYGETRLVREDEDLAEGFDEFVEDERVVLGRKAEKIARGKKREEIARLIAEQGGSDEEENERQEVYDDVQTRKGVFGSTNTVQKGDKAIKREFPPVADMASVISDLQMRLSQMKEARDQAYRHLAALAREKVEINEREEWTQQQLKETAAKYEDQKLSEL